MSKFKLPITVLIMTQDEELNISYALNSVVDFFDQVIVTDSYSKDSTLDIVKKYSNVDIYMNNFISWADQRNWMLENCKINNEIVFFLDADESISTDLASELYEMVGIDFNAIQLKVDMYFLGKHIKYSYGHPSINRIFKKKGLKFWGSGAREYANINDGVLRLKNSLKHQDHRGMFHWINKHNNNSTREALLYINAEKSKDHRELSTRLKIKLFVRNFVWDRLPLTLRPFAYFIFRYIIQKGFLDGRQGFLFCFFHAFWYHMLIDSKILEHKLKSKK